MRLRRTLARLLVALVLAGTVGCDQQNSRQDKGGPGSAARKGRTVAPSSSAPRPSRIASPPSAPGVSARVPSFQREIAPWLEVHCASAKSCHGEAPAWTVDLDLRPPYAWKALVDAEAERRLDVKRVKPGDVAGSFLVDKLTGHLRAREGKPMPLDPKSGRPVSRLPDDPDFLRDALVPWIAAGAPNN